MWIFTSLALSAIIMEGFAQELLNFTERDSKFLRDDSLFSIQSNQDSNNDWIPKISDQQAQPRNSHGYFVIREKGNSDHFPIGHLVSHFATAINHHAPPKSFRFSEYPADRQRNKPAAPIDNLRSASYKPTFVYALKPPGSISKLQDPFGFNNNRHGPDTHKIKSNAPHLPFRASQPLPLDEDFNKYRPIRISHKDHEPNVLFQKSIEPTVEELSNYYFKLYSKGSKSPSVTSFSIKDDTQSKLSNKHRHKEILAPPPPSSSGSVPLHYIKDGFKKNGRKPTTPSPITLYVTRPGIIIDSDTSLSQIKAHYKSNPAVRKAAPKPIFTLIDYDKLYAKSDEYIKPKPKRRPIQEDLDESDMDFFNNKTFIDFNKELLNPTPNIVAGESELSIERIFPEIRLDQSTEITPMTTTPSISTTTFIPVVEEDMENEENRFTNLDESTEIIDLSLLKMNLSIDSMIPIVSSTSPKTTILTRVLDRKMNGGSGDVCEKACMRNIINQEYNPVCGSDNRTYSNKGKFRCASICGRQKKLRILHPGTCLEAETSSKSP